MAQPATREPERAGKKDETGRPESCTFDLRTCPRRRSRPRWLRLHVPFNGSNLLDWPAEGGCQLEGRIRNTEAQFVADVLPPAQSTNAQFPLTGHAQGTYRFGPGELELAELTASTRATQVHASGTLSSSAALKLAVTTTNLGEWQPVFSAAGYAGQIPVTLKGHASFNGTATGKLTQIAIAGNVQSQDFETIIPATSHTPEKTINWNALQADIQLSPSVFAVRNGTLSRDPDSLKFDFHAQLDQQAVHR